MSADTGPAIAPRGVRKVFTTPPGELHTVVIGLDPTVGGCGFTAVMAPTGRGRPTTSTLVSGLEELMECEAVVPDEPLELWEGTRDSVVFGARALKESIAHADEGVALTAGPATGETEGARTARTVSRARAARGSRAMVAVPRLHEGPPTFAECRLSAWTPL
jgi:ABC-type nitrate/sulfonate/bicarbonate transport system ATPase subunit